MATRRQLLVVTCFIAVATVLAAACWSRAEIETLGFVMALGMDRSPSGKLQLTAHFAKPEALSSGADGSGTQEKPFWVVTVEGDTVDECLRKLGETSPRRPYLAHNRFFLFGEELLRTEGVMPVIDFIHRSYESRLASHMLVAKGTTARELLLQAEFEGASMPAEGGLQILLYLTNSRGTVSNITLRDFAIRMETEGIEPVAGGIEVVPLPSDTSIVGELTRTEVKSTARLGGTAIFKGDHLIGWLDDIETRGLNWITGKVKRTQLVFPQPDAGGGLATMDVIGATGRFNVEIQDGRPIATVKVTAVGNLGEVQGHIDLVRRTDSWQALSKGAESAIEREIMQTISRLQELRADAAGFGRHLFRQKPREWEGLKDWWDELFADMEVRVEVKVSLKSPGETLKSVRTE